jgi:predicted transcriptional regulator
MFAVLIIFMGFMHLIGDNAIGGLWWVLIGSFLFSAANSSYDRLMMKESFEGKTVRNFMNLSPVTVPSDITLQEFVDKYLYPYHYKMFPVVRENQIVGLITIEILKLYLHEEWKHLLVGSVMQEPSVENSITSNTPINDALNKMQESGYIRLLVVEEKKVVGIITLKDLLEYLGLKMELERLP